MIDDEAEAWLPILHHFEDVFNGRFNPATPEKRLEACTSALAFARQHGVPVAEWAMDYLYEALDRRCSLKAGSLDEAFDLPTYTEIKRKASEKNRATRWKLVEEFIWFRTRNKPIPWTDLADKYGVSERKAQEMCKDAGQHLPKSNYTKS